MRTFYCEDCDLMIDMIDNIKLPYNKTFMKCALCKWQGTLDQCESVLSNNGNNSIGKTYFCPKCKKIIAQG